MGNRTIKTIIPRPDQEELNPVTQAEVNKFLQVTPSSLAKGIRTCHHDVQSVKVKVTTAINGALYSACAAGFQLLAAKQKILRGGFGSFVRRSGISKDTAARYMGLAANFAHVRKMSPGTTLRKAYLLIGLIKSPEPKKLEQILPAKVRNLRKEITAVKSTTMGSAPLRQLTSQLRSLENTSSNLRFKLNAAALKTKTSTTKKNLGVIQRKGMAIFEVDPSIVLALFFR